MRNKLWSTALMLMCCLFNVHAQQKNQLRVHVGDITHTFSTHEVDSIDMRQASLYLPDSVQAVDMGLSVKWASCNIGASQPHRYGGYFAWGEAVEKTDYAWSTYLNGRIRDEKDCGTRLDPLFFASDLGRTAFDTATKLWGEEWRMPSFDEIKELRSRCTWTWNMLGGAWGYTVTGPSGASIFLPMPGFREAEGKTAAGACGIYLSSSRTKEYTDLVYGLFIDANNVDWTLSGRFYGHSIRPVADY